MILHVDMDAFYASVEQRDRPELRGKPVVVAFEGARSVLTTASYEARKFGCRSAQPLAVAKRLCPQAIVVEPRMDHYAAVSAQVFGMLEELSPLVEPLSIDEAFVDLTGTERLHGPPADTAERLRRRIREELSLTASAGVAENKFLAKLASDLKKPDGLTVVPRGGGPALLAPLPVRKIWGVGEVAERKLHGIGVRTIAELLACDGELLARTVGRGAADHWRALATGQDDRDVVPDSEAKSIGQERTFETDLGDPAEVLSVLLAEAEAVARRIRRSGLRAREVHVKIRYGAFETITRQTTLPQPTDATADVWSAARSLFQTWASASFRPVRLIGVSAGRFTKDGAQGDLFASPADERKRRLDRAVDALTDRFGDGTVARAAARRVAERSPSDHARRKT
ncbi:MAG: DNA polymerase IV 1 [Planctomycetes bacterium]|nr:DNA polymerase IV 1 [Planctomycetota bacterium]